MPRFAVWAICLGGIAVNVWCAWNLFLPGAAGTGRNDFLGLYAGGQLAGTPGLYNPATVRAAEGRVSGETGLPFPRLPYYALLLKPLTWMPYRTAYAVWEVVMLAALAAFAMLWPHDDRAHAWMLCCWSVPAWVSLFNGQDVALLLLWVALAARLLKIGWAAAAGAVLALCAAKYHLVVLVPLVVLAQRRWRMAAGAVAAGAVMLAASFLVAGVSWPGQYWAAMADPGIQQAVSRMPNLYALLRPLPFGLEMDWAAAVLVAATVFLAARRASGFAGPLALALVGSLLVSPHTYLADCALLLPALIIATGTGVRGGKRLSAIALASPVPWFLLQLPVPLPTVTRLLMVALVYTVAASLGLGWHSAAAPAAQTQAGATAGKAG